MHFFIIFLTKCVDEEFFEIGFPDQGTNMIKSFQGTHKCHRNTTKVLI